MFAYIVRRALYAIPILIGVNILTFALFFMVNTPDQMARVQLGDKHISEEAVEQWKQQRGYDKPLFLNTEENSQGLITDRSEEHTSELQSRPHLVCRLLL